MNVGSVSNVNAASCRSFIDGVKRAILGRGIDKLSGKRRGQQISDSKRKTRREKFCHLIGLRDKDKSQNKKNSIQHCRRDICKGNYNRALRKTPNRTWRKVQLKHIEICCSPVFINCQTFQISRFVPSMKIDRRVVSHQTGMNSNIPPISNHNLQIGNEIMVKNEKI